MTPATRPFIGVNADFVPASKQGAAEFRLMAGYCDAILAAGGLPVVVPPFGNQVEPGPLLDRLDGFVLTGGLDLDPRRLGMPSHSAVQPLPERRDESDKLLIKELLDRRLPLLAIGLGMQQLNVLCGGTLYLHLPADLPRAMPHRDPKGGVHRHLALPQPNTRLEEIYGGGELLVHSSHHQAVRQLGAGLRLAARAPDGVVEALEADDPDWFCVAVQWHPESDSATMLDLQLFEGLIQACLRQEKAVPRAASRRAS